MYIYLHCCRIKNVKRWIQELGENQTGSVQESERENNEVGDKRGDRTTTMCKLVVYLPN